MTLSTDEKLRECPYCGRKVEKLVPVTAEDIGRVRPPRFGFDEACEDCIPRIRDMARLVPEYSRAQALSYLSTRVPIITVVLVGLNLLVITLFGHSRIGGVSLSTFVGILAVFTGLQMIWNVSQNRYGATHDLKWSLTSKPAVRGFSVLFAGLLVATVAIYFRI